MDPKASSFIEEHNKPLGRIPANFLQEPTTELPAFLSRALSMAVELARFHASGLVHGHLTPHDFVIDSHTGHVMLQWNPRLISSRSAPPAQTITQANIPYLSPERIGRWRQELDSRSDLYSLGVIYFQMLTGSLPFAAADELGWFHSHLAKTPIFSEKEALQLPPMLRRIILKLLAKDLNERYQSANGLIHDLALCSSMLNNPGAYEEFALGTQDIPNKLQISGKIYGRQQEKARLLETFERVNREGHSEILLIKGYAGVGKTTLINELFEPVTSHGGFFISGKFERLNSSIPYYTYAQAFRALIAQILGESETCIAYWQQKLLAALGQLGQLIIELIPSLEIIIGKQNAVPKLPPQETQNRFHMVFRKFVGVFAEAQHPLLLFLDDLQWADAASLTLIEQLVTDQDLHHILFVGAFRSNEVDHTHPLMATIEAIRKAQGRVHEFELAPLRPDQIQSFLADTFATSPIQVESLAAVLHQKTAGNPFFLIQYLKTLADEKLLFISQESCQWTWNIAAIEARNYTDNVADFMLDRLRKLPATTQKILQYAACLGNKGHIEDLEIVVKGGNKTHKALDFSWVQGILLLENGDYRFLHDRLQQAALALLSADEQQQVHLCIARQLSQQGATGDEFLFKLMNHYLAARKLLTDPQERLQVARLSLIAAQKAKASAVCKSAVESSNLGLELLPQDTWEREYTLTIDLHLVQAECLWRSGESERAENYFAALLDRPDIRKEDQLRIYRTLIEVNTTQGKMQQALIQCQKALAVLGMDFPVHPTHEQVQDVYADFRASLANRPIEFLLDLLPITDPREKAALDTMAAAIPAAIFTSLPTASYLYCRMVHSSIVHGNSDAATSAYAYFAMILGSVFGEYQEAYRLGKVAYLLSQRGAQTWKARTYVIFGNVINFWTQPMRSNIPYVRAALPAALEVGDPAGACYSCNHLLSTLLALGQPLAEVYAEAERALQFVQTMNYPSIADIIIGQQRLIEALQGKTKRYSGVAEDAFDEAAYASRIFSSQMTLIKFWYHTWKLQSCYFLEQFDEGLEAADAARPLLWSSPGHVEELEHHFYHALILAQAAATATGDLREAYIKELTAYGETFRRWTINCPENFAHKHALIQAELSQLMNQDLVAMRCYEKAISLAQQNQFLQDEAISYERAARYYERAGFQAFCEHYAQEAKRCYESWGASAKVKLLDQRYPQLKAGAAAKAHETVGQPFDIDMISLLRATQSISGEIVPVQLSEKLMRLLVEASGAERGFLILARHGKLVVEAEAQTSAAELKVQMMNSIPLEDFQQLPKAILNFVRRSLEKVVIADARAPHAFAGDEFLKAHKPRSVLCLPILRNRTLVGIIYLENNLVVGAFTPDRLLPLEILASQAAISIENASLYANLSQEKEKLRATIEGMVDGLIVSDFNAKIILINDAALQIFGVKSRTDDLMHNRWELATQIKLRDAHDDPVPFEELPLSRALKGETLVQSEYHFCQVGSGRAIVVRVSAAPMRQPSGSIQGAVLVLRDVTGLVELDRLKDEFLRAMAHELKTPLMVVTGYFELYKILIKKGGKEAALQETMLRIDKGFDRLKSLIATLVDVAVFQLGKLRLQMDDFDLLALCHELLASLANSTQTHKLIFVAHDPQPLMIRGDRLRLGQVLTSFLQNAIKYSPDGGDIELQIDDEPDFVVVSVKDHGIGIPLDRQDRLFQRFYRAHAETKHDYGGMGVGLFLAQEIIQAHQGSIAFSSHPETGSTFSFRLPKVNARISNSGGNLASITLD